MLTIRYIIRLITAFFSRFKVLILIALFAGILFFFILRSILTNTSKSSEIIGITGRYTVSNLPETITNKIGEGLTDLDFDGNAKPGLAAAWYTPDKGKTWIFKLKDNLKWQDEKPVKSSDISYRFSDVVESRPDEKTIEFQLQNAYSAFPVIVSKPIFKKGLLGVGAWQVKKLKLSGNFIEDMILINNEKQTIEYKFYPTEEKTKLAFKLGHLTKIESLSTITPFDKWKRITITESTKNDEYVGVFFNNEDKILSEKTIRQALNYAIDKKSYENRRAISPISPNSWAYNSQVKKYDTDIKKAKEMIDQYKKDSKQDEMTITLSTYPILLNEAEKVAKNWEEVGLKVNIVSLAGDLTDYQALMAIFDIPDDPDQYSIWHSTQTATNITKYQNPRIDKLLEDGRGEIDINSRRRIYLDFQRFLIEDSPVAFLYYPSSFTISKR